MFSLKIDTIQFGWCALCFCDEKHAVTVHASSVLNDCMEELVLLAIHALHNVDGFIFFFEEPTMLICRIESSDGKLLIKLGKVELETVNIRFARQVSAAFARYLRRHSQNEYHQSWGHGYPGEKLSALSTAIKQAQRYPSMEK